MKDSERQKLVAAAAAGAQPGAGGFVRIRCPLCVYVTGKEDRKGALSLSMRTGFYECFKCGRRGRVDAFADGVALPPAAPGEGPELGEWALPPDGFWYLDDLTGAVLAEPARRYLRDVRKLDERLWSEARIGACLEGFHAGRVVVPILDTDGATWLGWVARVWKKKAANAYRYPRNMPRESLLYNAAALNVHTAEPVLVVEGVFDALALWPDAVAVLGKPSARQVRALVCCDRPVVTVLDGDAWEEGRALAELLQFEGQQAGFVRLPPRMDPDEMPVAELKAQARACIEETA